MELQNNPYSPGAGRAPVALVGRDYEIDVFTAYMIRLENGRDARPIAMYGLRGVGKTALLRHLKKIADENGWYTPLVESLPEKSLREKLVDSFDEVIRQITKEKVGLKAIRALKTLLNFRASVGILGMVSFGIDFKDESGAYVESGILENDLTTLLETVIDHTDKKGIMLFIDEAHELTLEELRSLAYIAHNSPLKGMKFNLVIAGLPTLPAQLSDARSYSERLFEFWEIGKLDNEYAKRALVEPALTEGATWEESALSAVVSDTKGYPYFLQEYGANAWNSASDNTILLSDVENTIEISTRQLDLGFYRSRWDRTTPSEKKYLRAMAQDGGNVSKVSEIANRLGVKQQSLSINRQELIRKGIIYSPEHGEVAFSVPLMFEFIHRQLV
jgi:DNA-binding MarR family transcriptional regulator